MNVTKQWLAGKLSEKPNYVVGRALLAIYRLQIASEQRSGTTCLRNGVGFSKPDARTGSIGAKAFEATGKVPDWVAKIWISQDKSGFPRICKYARQLNKISLSHDDAKNRV